MKRRAQLQLGDRLGQCSYFFHENASRFELAKKTTPLRRIKRQKSDNNLDIAHKGKQDRARLKVSGIENSSATFSIHAPGVMRYRSIAAGIFSISLPEQEIYCTF